MTYFVTPGDDAADIAGAINYVLANLGSQQGLIPDETTGQILDSNTQVVFAYLYRFMAVKYADSATPNTIFDVPTNHTYFGIRNSNSTSESTNPADYIWTQVTGGFGTTKFLFYRTTGGRQIDFQVATTSPGTAYIQVPNNSIPLDLDVLSAAQGAAGANGVSTYTLAVYIASATGTVPGTPQANTGSWNFNTASGTVPTGTPASQVWSLTPPTTTVGQSVYVSYATLSTMTPNVTVTAPNWSTPVILAATGAAGADGRSTYLFQVFTTTANATAPSGGTWNFGTSTGTVPTGGGATWTLTPTAGSANYSTQALASVLGNTGTWSGTASSWSAPTQFNSLNGANAWTSSIGQQQYTFPQNSDGTYTVASQNINATFSNIFTSTSATVVATVAANGNVTLTYPSPTSGITTTFVSNGTKLTAVMFTHTASGAVVGASVVALTFPTASSTNGITNVTVGGATVATLPTPVQANFTYSNGQTFSQAPNAGAWTPTPVSSVITSVTTVQFLRGTTVVGADTITFAYNTVLGTWVRTGSGTTPTTITYGTATQSMTQFKQAVTYTDANGTLTDYIQFDVVIGGARGAPGPANIVRYGRFDSRTAAITQGPPQTANGIDGYWVRSPDIFPSSSPYTHTTTQFINDVTAGAPYKTNLVLSGTAGGSYLPGQQEIQTETITPGHTTSAVVNEISQLMVSGNTGSNPSGVQVGCSIQYFNSSGVAQTFTGNIFLAANLSTQATIGAEFVNDLNTAKGSAAFTASLDTSNNVVITRLYGGNTIPPVFTVTQSADLPTNTARTSGTTNQLGNLLGDNRGIATNGAGTWVAIGTNGVIVYSTDNAVTWSVATGTGTLGLNSIYYGGGKFVAVGNNGAAIYSTTGNNWAQVTGITQSLFSQNLYSVYYSGSQWVAVGSASIYYSPNGQTWTQATGASSGYFTSVYSSGSQWVAVGNSGSIYYSPNGQTWTQATGAGSNAFNSVYYGGGQFVAVGSGIYYSTNGQTWTQSTGTGSATFYSVYSSGSQWVAVGTSIYYSTNGQTWTQATGTGSVIFYSVYYSGSQWVAVGSSGAVYYSANGQTWTQATGTGSSIFRSNRGFGNLFVAVGDNGTIYTIDFTGSVSSSVTISTPTTPSEGSSPSSITYNNVQQATNRAQLQITGAPTVVGNVRTWPVSVITSTGSFGFGINVIFDAQTTLQGTVYEGTGTLYTFTGFSGAIIGYNGSSLSIDTSAYPSIASNLNTLTTGNYVFLQDTTSTASSMTVLFSSQADATQQALDICTAFNTTEVAYTASCNANVVTLTSSNQTNLADISHGGFSIGSATSNARIFMTINNIASSALNAGIANFTFTNVSGLTTLAVPVSAGQTLINAFSNLYFTTISSNWTLLSTTAFSTAIISTIPGSRFTGTVTASLDTSGISWSGSTPTVNSIGQPDGSGTQGTAVPTDFTLAKTQDGRVPYTVSSGTRDVVTLTKAGNIGAGSTSVTLDYGAPAVGGNPNPNSVSVQSAINTGLNQLYYYTRALNTSTTTTTDIDPTSGGNLTVTITPGTGSTLAIANNVIDTGVAEVVVGDPLRWTQPVNTGIQVT